MFDGLPGGLKPALPVGPTSVGLRSLPAAPPAARRAAWDPVRRPAVGAPYGSLLSRGAMFEGLPGGLNPALPVGPTSVGLRSLPDHQKLVRRFPLG